MKKFSLRISSLLFGAIIFTACNRSPSSVEDNDWKLGVALYTFHTFSFPDALAKADSSGVAYVEGFTFEKAGADLDDSLVLQLSSAGIDKLKELIQKSGLHMESIYVVGGK